MALIDYDAVTFPGIRIDDEGGAATFALTCREARTRIVSQPLGLRLLTEISQNAPVFPAWGGSIKIDRAKLPIEAGGGKADYDDEESFSVGLGRYMNPGANGITENMSRLEHGVAIRHKY